MQLTVENLIVRRGGRDVLSGLSFELSGGEGLMLTGPNGAGKTTLIRTVAGFLRPDEGRVRLHGVADGEDVATQCLLVGHLNGVKSSLTVAENLRFWGSFLGSGDEPEIEKALARLGLASIEDLPAGYLSAGQKRRLSLARLLVAPRPLWLLDEPTVSLDAASQAVVGAMVREHVAGGGIAIAATHIPLGLVAMRELKLGQPAGATA